MSFRDKLPPNVREDDDDEEDLTPGEGGLDPFDEDVYPNDPGELARLAKRATRNPYRRFW